MKTNNLEKVIYLTRMRDLENLFFINPMKTIGIMEDIENLHNQLRTYDNVRDKALYYNSEKDNLLKKYSDFIKSGKNFNQLFYDLRQK